MVQWQVEEAAATALELFEAEVRTNAKTKAAGESDVRARHRQLVEQAKGAAA